MKNTKPKIVVVLGPTATGKSDLAVEMAKRFNGEIISADSRQVYKGMDIGTGKITKKEMRGIPHYLLNVIKPNAEFSVTRYQALAKQAVKKILNKNKLPIVCGGTGFYIDALVSGMVLPEVPPDKELRKKLERKSIEILFKKLEKLDPKRAKNIDKYNKVRLIRAIEIAKALGKVPEMKKESLYNPLFIGLNIPDTKLKERIVIRLKGRMNAGMIQEVDKLHKQGTSWKRLERFGLEYRNCALLLQNKTTKEKMIQNLEKEIWHYVKRQRTWFKRNKEIIWLNPLKKNEMIEAMKLIKVFCGR